MKKSLHLQINGLWLALFFLFSTTILHAQKERYITDTDLTGTETWYSDTTYYLDGIVYLESGTLYIQPGTVIKALQNPNTGDEASMLIITRDARMEASGTMAQPIIFTSDQDDLGGNLGDSDRGYWAGIFWAGNASNNSTAGPTPGEMVLEGLADARATFGGGASPNDAHDGGFMNYVSIRHAGGLFNTGLDAWGSGLALGSVGSQTTISYVEVYASGDDAIEIYGGLPQLDHIVLAYAEDDLLDTDAGFRGKAQFILGIQGEGYGDNFGEHDGGVDNDTDTPLSVFEISNVTYLGREKDGSGSRTLRIRDFSGAKYYNSIFANQDNGVRIEYIDGTNDSYGQYAINGNIEIKNTIFWNIADDTDYGIFSLDDQGGASTEYDTWAAEFANWGNVKQYDPGIAKENPLPAFDVSGADFTGLDAFFEVVPYKGAFDANGNWAGGWTRLYYNKGYYDETTQLTPDLLAYYPFTQNPLDTTGNGNHATAFGAYSFTENSIRLEDSELDYLQINGGFINGAQDFTIEGNVKINAFHIDNTSFPSNHFVSLAHPDNTNRLVILYVANDSKWTVGFDDFWFDYFDTSIEDMGWHHIALIREKGTLRFYIDGNQLGDAQYAHESPLDIDASGFILGQDQDVVGGGFDRYQSLAGQISDFKVYNSVRYNGPLAYPQMQNITFQVNMNKYISDGFFNPVTMSVDIAGSFNSWGNNYTQLYDGDGDGIYEITLHDFNVGDNIEYKFRIDARWDIDWHDAGDNRTYTVIDGDNTLYHWFNYLTFGNELEVSKLESQQAGHSLTASESISVLIKNNGASQVSDIPISYEVNGGGFVHETFVGPLDPGQEATFTFSTTYDFSVIGVYNITVALDFPSDEYQQNDTLYEQIFNKNIFTTGMAYDFESDDPNWTTYGNNNSWERGVPSGTYINPSIFITPGTNAWVTNLYGQYNNNELSYVEGPYFDFTSITNPGLNIKFFSVTEMHAGAVVEYTIDEGQTWNMLTSAETGVAYPNYVDPFSQMGYPESNGFTNYRGYWEEAIFDLSFLAGNPLVKFRIAFASNNVNAEDEGIAFDDFILIDRPANDIQIATAQTKDIMAGEVSWDIILRNNGTTNPGNVDVVSNILGSAQTFNFTAPDPGQSSHESFTHTGLALTPAQFVASVYLNNTDDNMLNDTMYAQLTVADTISSFPYIDDFESTTYWHTQSDDVNKPLYFYQRTAAGQVINTGANSVYSTNPTGMLAWEAQPMLISPYFDFTGLTNPVVEFEIWRDLKDQDAVALLYDTGAGWNYVGNTGEPYNWYNENQGLSYMPDFGSGAKGWNNITDDGFITVRHDVLAAAGQVTRFAIIVRGDSDGNITEGVAIDNFQVYETPGIDLRLNSLVQPASNVNLSASETIEVEIFNDGQNDVSGFDISFSTDGGSTFTTENYASTLLSGTSMNYTFTATADVSSYQVYDVILAVHAAGDGFTLNDTLYMSFRNEPLFNTYPYVESFEGTSYWNDGGENSSWQVGEPNGPTIQGASEGMFAWVTNLTGNANPNEFSYVESPYFDFSAMVSPRIKLDVWARIDGNQGAKLQFTTDGGETWYSVGNVGNTTNWYNSYSDVFASRGFANNDSWAEYDGYWKNAYHDLDWLAGEPQVKLRIIFGTLDVTDMEGFGFDNVFIYDANHDMELSQITTNSGCDLNSASIDVELTNVGNSDEINFPIYYSINGNTPINETVTATVFPGSKEYFSFATPADFTAQTINSLKVWTAVTDDGNAMNDTLEVEIINQPLISSFPYFDDFESGQNWATIYQEGDGMSWESGEPMDEISEAFSGVNAWTTNLNGAYTNYEWSYLISPCFDFSALTSPMVEFQRWVSIEDYDDGVVFMYSTDGGALWNPMGWQNDNDTWYNYTSSGGESGVDRSGHASYWTGSTNGWEHTYYNLDFLAGQSNVKFAFMFINDYDDNWSGFALDDFMIRDNPDYDMGITGINFSGACGLSSAEVLSFNFKNYGLQMINSFNIAYSINSGAKQTQHFDFDVYPGDVPTVNLDMATADFSAEGYYDIKAWVEGFADGYADNDTMWFTVVHTPTYAAPYTEDFEGGENYWYSYGDNVSWEFGTPSGTAINAAFSGTNAWATSLSNNYNSHEDSYLESPCFDLSGVIRPFVQFKVWAETEECCDNMRLEYSIDNGQSWTELYEDMNSENWNLTGAGWGGSTAGYINAKTELKDIAGASSVKFRFHFTTNDNTEGEGIAMDDFELIDGALSNDLRIQPVMEISDGCGLGKVPVVVGIRNIGLNPVSSYDVNFQINANAIVTENITTTLNSSDEIVYEFQTDSADFSAVGSYDVKVWLSNYVDDDNTSDTIGTTLHHKPEISTFPYLQDFESAAYWTIDDWENTSWEKGLPSGSIINSAYSGSNAWKTNLTGNYFDNEHATLTGPCFDFSGLVRPAIEFKAWIETEECCDYMYMEYSTDGGNNWQRLYDEGGSENWNYTYDGWRGSTGGWINVWTDMPNLAGKPNVQLRFVFYSDGGTTSDGVAIDDIRIYENALPDDLEMYAIYSPYDGCGLTNVPVEIEFKNVGVNDATNFEIGFEMPDGSVFTEIFTEILASGGVKKYTFQTHTATFTEYGEQQFKFWVAHNADTEKNNDTSFINIFHQPYISSFPYVDDFEGQEVWKMDFPIGGSGGRYWLIGQPNGNKIVGAYSGTNALYSEFGYDDYETSLIAYESPCFDFTNVLYPMLEFAIWRDLPVGAYVAIQAKVGEGVWQQIGKIGDTDWYNSETEYPMNTNGIYGTEGWTDIQDANWITLERYLEGYGGYDNVKIRLLIQYNNSFPDNDIVAFDDITVYDNVPSNDLGITTQMMSGDWICDASEPQYVEVDVYNNGMNPISNFDLGIRVDDVDQVFENLNITVNPGDTVHYVFENPIDLYHTNYSQTRRVKVFFTTPDGYSHNDTLHFSKRVLGDVTMPSGFEVLSICTGMADFYANDILVHSSGDIWVATYNGLSRYDGGNFTNYGLADGLPHLRTRTLLEDQYGDVWISVDSGGVVRYNGSTFEVFPVYDQATVTDIVEDPSGDIWFSSNNNGLFRYNGGSFDHWNQDNSPIANNTVNNIGVMPDGRLFVSTNNGFYGFDGNNWDYIEIPNSNYNRARLIFNSSDGHLWVNSYDQIHEFDGTNWTTYQINIYGYDAVEEAPGVFWLSDVYSQTVMKFDNGSIVEQYSSPELIPGMENSNFYQLAIDDNGTRYFGVYWEGIIKWVPADKFPTADAGSPQSVNEGDIATLDASGSLDWDGSTANLSYEWIAPEGIELSDPNAVNPTFTAPEVVFDQDFNIQLIVSNQLTTVEPVWVTVTVVNVANAPMFSSFPADTAKSGQLYSYDLVAVDPDGDALTITESILPSWMSLTNVSSDTATTIAGLGPISDMIRPIRISSDGAGNFYVPDYSTGFIFKIDNVGSITKFAGNGSRGYSGDGGQALDAELNTPYSAAVMPDGSVLIADFYNHVIRHVASNGVITTFAGTGAPNTSGDGGKAIDADLNGPFGLSITPSGEVLVSEYFGQVVRKIGTDSTITTVAGNGEQAYYGDGGLAVDAALSNPAMAVEYSGEIYIVDGSNNVIRKVDGSGNISTVVGTGESGIDDPADGGDALSGKLSSPRDIAFDASGNMYIADRSAQRIRIVDGGNIINTYAGDGTAGFKGDGGPANVASLNNPYGLTVYNDELYIADPQNSRIRVVDVSDNIQTYSGETSSGYEGDGGLATAAKLNWPADVDISSTGEIYFTEYGNHIIRKIDLSGNISTVAGTGSANFSGDGGLATSAELSSPEGIYLTETGEIYVADAANSRIRMIDLSGNITTIAGTGDEDFYGDGGPATSAALNYPSAIDFDSNGNMYLADFNNNRIRMIDQSGNIHTIAGTGVQGYNGEGVPAISAQINTPYSIYINDKDEIFFTEFSGQRIRKIDIYGDVYTVAGTGEPGFDGDGGPAVNAKLRSPADIEIDEAGNIYLADQGNSRVRMINTNGDISTVAGYGSTYGSLPSQRFNGEEGEPNTMSFYQVPGVAVNGNTLYLSDFYNHRIRKVDLKTYTYLGTPTNELLTDNVMSFDASDGGSSVNQYFELNIKPETNKFIVPWTEAVDPVTIIIEGATIDGADMQPGDEIAVFDDAVCVGYGILTDVVSPGVYTLEITASRNTATAPEVNGYNEYAPVNFRLFDISTDKEIFVVDAQVLQGELKYIPNTTIRVSLNGQLTNDHRIPLTEGWNIISSYNTPGNLDMKNLVQPLIDRSSLVKVQAEDGTTIDEVAGFTNFIGDFSNEEGYKVKVNANDTLIVNGENVQMPYSISLLSGWNIIGFPVAQLTRTTDVFGQLMDNYELVKVMNEKGMAIDSIGGIGWIDMIQYMKPGEGYYIKVKSGNTLTLNPLNWGAPTKSTTISVQGSKAQIFVPAWTGNGADHMNFYFRKATLDGFDLSIGDEIAVYCNGICVGATAVSTNVYDVIPVVTSFDDPATDMVDGFTNGLGFEVRVYDRYNEQIVTNVALEQISGDESFTRFGTAVLELKATSDATSVIDLETLTANMDIYPNPIKDEGVITIQLAEKTSVQLNVFNALGEKINALADTELKPGEYTYTWKSDDTNQQKVNPGIYVIELRTNNTTISKRVVVIK